MLKPVLLGFALSTFALLGTAEAAIVKISYSGVLTEGTDATNVFKVATTNPASDVNLANLPVVVSYVFDTSKGKATDAPGEHAITGGTFNSLSSPALSTTVTINGQSFTFVGDALGIIAASDAYASTSHLGQIASSSNGDGANSALDAALGTFTASITGPLSLDAKAQSFTALTFFNLSNGASGDFLAQTVSVSAVPLPASLPLLGFALAGLGIAAVVRKRSGSNAGF